MALKYFIQYQDVVDITHRWELFDDDFNENPIEVRGTIFLDAAGTDNPLEPFRGLNLRVDLIADQDLTFDDLFSEEQRTFKVSYIRDNITKFNGFLNPEGWFESYVTDKWVVSFDCVDGLGFLENLSYVDETGLFFLGKQSLLEVISNCLIRTGIIQNINTSIEIHYTGLSTSLDVLDNVFTNAQRFIKDDGDTIMSCTEVLKSVLEPFAACITTVNGEWFIYKPNQLFLNKTLTHFRYDHLGVALAPPTSTIDTSLDLGSQINNFAIFHCNSNQSIRINNSIGAFRISYKFGVVQSLIDNSLFFSSDQINLDDWNIITAFGLNLPATGFGVDFDINQVTDVIALDSDVIILTIDLVLDFEFKIENLSATFSYDAIMRYQVFLEDDSSADIYYMNESGFWIVNNNTIKFDVPVVGIFPTGTDFIKLIIAQPLPVDGDLTIRVFHPLRTSGPIRLGAIRLTEISVSIESGDGGLLKGEFHTVEREDKPSTKTEDIKEVTVGDNPTDVFQGTLYKTDETTPTETWSRDSQSETLPILGIMAQETLRLSSKPARVFSGSAFGFFEYLSTVSIDTLSGVFMPISYSYDTKNNIITSDFIQIFGDELSDIDYKITFDFGETVKPTIKG